MTKNTHPTAKDAEELDGFPGNTILYSDKCWAVLRKQSHGGDWITDHTSHAKRSLTSAEVFAWADDWLVLLTPGAKE